MSSGYAARRGRVEHYFDRTASAAWARLTSDAPVSGVRATVRAGRDRMRAQLLAYLPDDLRGARVLDAGCGPGALAVALAARGAQVVASDLSPTLVAIGRERAAGTPGGDRITWHVGDMLDPSLGRFDYAVAMDSLIHYAEADAADALVALMRRSATGSMLGARSPRGKARPAACITRSSGVAGANVAATPRAERRISATSASAASASA
jgi:magnesium-protoporphyrin O-methyltransferase